VKFGLGTSGKEGNLVFGSYHIEYIWKLNQVREQEGATCVTKRKRSRDTEKMGDERFKSLAKCFRERGDQRDCTGKLRNNYPLGDRMDRLTTDSGGGFGRERDTWERDSIPDRTLRKLSGKGGEPEGTQDLCSRDGPRVLVAGGVDKRARKLGGDSGLTGGGGSSRWGSLRGRVLLCLCERWRVGGTNPGGEIRSSRVLCELVLGVTLSAIWNSQGIDAGRRRIGAGEGVRDDGSRSIGVGTSVRRLRSDRWGE
jgi:hypothetical protein